MYDRVNHQLLLENYKTLSTRSASNVSIDNVKRQRFVSLWIPLIYTENLLEKLELGLMTNTIEFTKFISTFKTLKKFKIKKKKHKMP